jgi:hypothetical protein
MKTLSTMTLTPQFKLRTSISTLLATLALTSTAGEAAGVNVFVQAPFEYSTGAFDLDKIETYNKAPVYSKSFSIPYANLQALAIQMMKDNVDRTISGKVQCTDPCPDVDYSVTVGSEFEFTQTSQPTVQPFGDANENGVTVNLNGVQARIKLNISVHAETWFDSANTQVPIEVFIGAHGNASAKLWPTLDVPQSNVVLTLDGKNVEINGLNGEVVQLGAELGTVIGFSPVGFLVGGPLGGAIIGAIGGNAAADEAERRIKAIIASKLDGAITLANSLIKNELTKYITPTVAQANAIKDNLLAKPLPGIGKSLTTLQNDWGLNLDVRTAVRNNILSTVATTRFSPTPNGGSLFGRVRFPKTQCQYAAVEKGIVTFKMPIATEGHNTDLAAKVGQDCNSVFNSQDLNTSIYLGENPETKLNSGNAANNLVSWVSAGLVNFTSTLQDKGKYFECSYAVTGYPAMAISKLEFGGDLGGRITDFYPESERVLHLPVGQFSAQFNSEIQPYGSNGVILGGNGPDSVEECPSKILGVNDVIENHDFKDRFNPDNCPNCGFEKEFGKHGEVILWATNPDAFQGVLSTPIVSNELNNFGGTVSLNPQPLPPKSGTGIASQVITTPSILNQGVNAQVLQQRIGSLRR